MAVGFPGPVTCLRQVVYSQEFLAEYRQRKVPNFLTLS